MALSVLSIEKNKGIYGIYDSLSGKFILTGSSNEMYKVKHELEEAEQQDDNKQYFEDLISKYKEMFDSIKLLENGKSSTIHKKIELFQKYLKQKK